MPEIRSRTFTDIQLGDQATYTRTVEERDIVLFAAVSGDINPLHLDPTYAAGTRFGERIAHGMLTGAFVSACLAIELLGPGTIYLSQTLNFRLPVKIGDTVTVTLEVAEKHERHSRLTLDCKVRNQHGKLVVTGTAEVMAPTQPCSVPLPELPPISIGDRASG
jgi:acyl dehydratase